MTRRSTLSAAFSRKVAVAALLALPTLLYGFVSAAEKADKCAEIAKSAEQAASSKSNLKCE